MQNVFGGVWGGVVYVCCFLAMINKWWFDAECEHFRSPPLVLDPLCVRIFHDGIKISHICFCVSNCVITENVFPFKT